MLHLFFTVNSMLVGLAVPLSYSRLLRKLDAGRSSHLAVAHFPASGVMLNSVRMTSTVRPSFENFQV
jgi:hypothetical protein